MRLDSFSGGTALLKTTIGLPDPDYPVLTDIDLVGATTGDGWGQWVEVYSDDNETDDDVFDEIAGELSFDPQWIGGPNANGQVEIKIDHVDDTHTLVRSVLPYLNLHIPVVSGTPEVQSVPIFGAAILQPGHHLVVRARARRQNARAGTVKIISSHSSLERIRFSKQDLNYTIRTQASTQGRLYFGSTFSGNGQQATPYQVANPFSSALHTKLDGIEDNATADLTPNEIVVKLESLTGMSRLSATHIRDLPSGSAPTSLGGLTDVSVSNPQNDEVLTYVIADRNFQLKRLPPVDFPKVVEGIEALAGTGNALDRTTLKGETAILGGTSLPDISAVPHFTLRIVQPSNADTPQLHIASANYDVPATNRNELSVTLANGVYRLADTDHGGSGSTSNNYNNFLGLVNATNSQVTIAINWAIVNSTYTANPPLHTYATTPASGIGATTFNLRTGADRYITIDGKQYTQYQVISSAVGGGLRAIAGQQDWEFSTNASGTSPLNFHPATRTHAGSWHYATQLRIGPTLLGDGTATNLEVANPFTPAEKAKLGSITSGAEPNVKSDWDASTGDAEILNKPVIPVNLTDLSDVTINAPDQGQAITYDRARQILINTTLDNPIFANVDKIVNNVSASSGDHLLYTYVWSDLQQALISFALSHLMAYRLMIDIDQPFHSIKFRKTGTSGSFIGSEALSGRVNGVQTATGTGLASAMLSQSFDIYGTRSTSVRANLTRVRLFLYLYR